MNKEDFESYVGIKVKLGLGNFFYKGKIVELRDDCLVFCDIFEHKNLFRYSSVDFVIVLKDEVDSSGHQ